MVASGYWWLGLGAVTLLSSCVRSACLPWWLGGMQGIILVPAHGTASAQPGVGVRVHRPC